MLNVTINRALRYGARTIVKDNLLPPRPPVTAIKAIAARTADGPCRVEIHPYGLQFPDANLPIRDSREFARGRFAAGVRELTITTSPLRYAGETPEAREARIAAEAMKVIETQVRRQLNFLLDNNNRRREQPHHEFSEATIKAIAAACVNGSAVFEPRDDGLYLFSTKSLIPSSAGDAEAIISTRYTHESCFKVKTSLHQAVAATIKARETAEAKQAEIAREAEVKQQLSTMAGSIGGMKKAGIAVEIETPQFTRQELRRHIVKSTFAHVSKTLVRLTLAESAAVGIGAAKLYYHWLGNWADLYPRLTAGTALIAGGFGLIAGFFLSAKTTMAAAFIYRLARLPRDFKIFTAHLLGEKIDPKRFENIRQRVLGHGPTELLFAVNRLSEETKPATKLTLVK
jgi:hypothetical protein